VRVCPILHRIGFNSCLLAEEKSIRESKMIIKRLGSHGRFKVEMKEEVPYRRKKARRYFSSRSKSKIKARSFTCAGSKNQQDQRSIFFRLAKWPVAKAPFNQLVFCRSARSLLMGDPPLILDDSRRVGQPQGPSETDAASSGARSSSYRQPSTNLD
jgi:hypothetical protein